MYVKNSKVGTLVDLLNGLQFERLHKILNEIQWKISDLNIRSDYTFISLERFKFVSDGISKHFANFLNIWIWNSTIHVDVTYSFHGLKRKVCTVTTVKVRR